MSLPTSWMFRRYPGQRLDKVYLTLTDEPTRLPLLYATNKLI